MPIPISNSSATCAATATRPDDLHPARGAAVRVRITSVRQRLVELVAAAVRLRSRLRLPYTRRYSRPSDSPCFRSTFLNRPPSLPPEQTGRPPAVLAEAPAAGRQRQLLHANAARRPPARDGVRERPLPQPARVLVAPDRHVHDPRQRLHPAVRLLLGPQGRARLRSRTTSRRASPRRPPGSASSTSSSRR